MTFKEYLAAIQENNTIFCIEEYVDNKFVGHHMVFGFNEADEDTTFEKNGVLIDTKDDYVLYGADGYSVPTFIDTAQKIELKNNDPSVYVTDRDGVRINLTFFVSSPIPHPTQN